MEAAPLGHPLLVSIHLSVDISSPPIMMTAAIGLISSALPPPLILATMIVGQMIDRLMKGATVSAGKGKSVTPISLLLAELAKPPVKVTRGLVEGLFLESCPDKELLVKQFCSSCNHGYIVVTSLEKGGWSLL